MDKLGIGLIGCGGRLRGVTKELLQQDERLQVVALSDPSPASIQAANEAFCDGQAKIYDDYHDLVADPNVAWVMIGSWNCFHRDHAVAAFEAGKHVFCEKPLATTAEDCQAMFAAWRKSGSDFVIGFTLRFSPHYRRIRKIISSGTLGKLVSLEFNETLDFNHGGYIMADWRRLRANAGTHMLEKCCHDIDIINWMVDSHATRVASFGGLNFFTSENAHHVDRIGQNKHGSPAYGSWPSVTGESPFTADKDILDNQVVIMEFANGVRASFHANCNAAIPERRMLIYGTEGALRADVLTGQIEVQRIGWDTAREQLGEFDGGGHGGGDDVLARELAETMLDGTPPTISLVAGYRAALTCFGIDTAADTGTVVDMMPLWRDAGLELGEDSALKAHEPALAAV